MELDLVTTLICTGVSVAAAIGCGYMGAQPINKNGDIRMVPWRFLMLLAGTAAIVFLAHLLTLTGLKTDPPPRY